MTTFKKLKYDSNLKPRFSKGKAPSDDLDINYLHQRLDQLKEINDLQELKNKLKSIANWWKNPDSTGARKRLTTPKTTRLNINVERSFKNGIHDIANN